ncbi:hypothetical protein QEZ54_16475 [Catellatospora sp. KI3]|uniref:hypothetical protein n=1 Tax=Catellatospora sp. KI3 TaxID=3041620 RepID=UPI002482D255|nr:hypothetical protein [Catellatospora sp. KI3]MDI1462569.1 hypothetical protein [Catellatospora sp. KI3]
MEPDHLHTAARRHLMDRYQQLTTAYSRLPNHGRAADGYHYTPEARQIFPRCHVAAAILDDVERLDPERLPPPAQLAEALVHSARSAASVFTSDARDAGVIADERRRFEAVVADWLRPGRLPVVAPLPYRRVLAAEESRRRQELLAQRWGLVGRVWHPMLGRTAPPAEVLVLNQNAVYDEGAELVRRILREYGAGRVTELREDGADRLLDVELVELGYHWAEGVWSDDSLSWMAYASHEDTVAVGGRLAEALAERLPHLDEWRWHGW